MSRRRRRRDRVTAWERIRRTATTFDPRPVQPPPPPETRRLDPVTRAFRLLAWRFGWAAASLTPDGTIHAVGRWCLRMGTLIALPLGVVWVAILLLQAILSGLGGILGSLLGIGCIVLAVAILALRLSR